MHACSAQVYLSTLWPAFRYLQLTESCRQDKNQRRFSELLSRVRLGREYLTEDDITLLKSRVCGNKSHHGVPKSKCCIFDDVVTPMASKRRLRRQLKQQRRFGTQSAEQEPASTKTRLYHCPIGEGSTVIAALCGKVQALNDAHVERVRNTGIDILQADATDRLTCGLEINDPTTRDNLDKEARGQPRTLSYYEGTYAQNHCYIQVYRVTLQSYSINQSHTDGMSQVCLQCLRRTRTPRAWISLTALLVES